MRQGTGTGAAPKSEVSLDDILEKSTVRFSEPLTIHEIKKLLEYIAKTLPARISYHASQHFFIYGKNEGDLTEPGTPSVTGTIASLNEIFATDSFSSVPSDGIPKISLLRFSPIPGYTLTEHRLEIVSLWEDVKTLAEAYFRLIHKK